MNWPAREVWLFFLWGVLIGMTAAVWAGKNVLAVFGIVFFWFLLEVAQAVIREWRR